MQNYRITRTYCLSFEAVQELKMQAEKAGVPMSRYLEDCIWAKKDQKDKEAATQ